jgi:hypothetical protein
MDDMSALRTAIGEHGGEQTNTPKGVCSCSFAEQPLNNVRECSLFAKNVRLAPRRVMGVEKPVLG